MADVLNRPSGRPQGWWRKIGTVRRECERLRNAEVLILDEPTNHLDEAAKQWLMDFVRNFDQTMIYVSHEESMIQLADRKIAVQR